MATSSKPASHPGARARVLIVGLAPWGTVAASDLAEAGVGAVHALDDRAVGDDDLEAVRLFADGDRGRPRGAALAAAIAARAPGCTFTTGSLVAAPDRPLALADTRWDLVITGLDADDLLVAEATARFAHAAGIPSLGAHLEGLELVLGPGVVPGRTPCHRCFRLRRLALSRRPAIDHALHAALLAERPRPRARTYAAPMPALAGHALAHAALSMLAEGEAAPIAGHLVAQHLVTLESTRHAALRLPRCAVCGDAPAADPAGSGVNLDDAADPAALRRMLAGVVDARAGVVRTLVIHAPDTTLDPETPIAATALLSRFTEGTEQRHACSPGDGAGKGLTAVSALISAVGEAVERYSVARHEHLALPRRPVSAMKGDFLAPADLCPYSEGQLAEPDFPFARLDPETPIDWVRGAWLDTGAPVEVPALPTFMHHPAPPEAYFCEVTSNGLAAGPTLAAAAFSAALELVERDAFMISWLARRPGRTIQLDASIDAGAREAARQLEHAGARVALYLLDAGLGVPTVACVAYGDGDRWPGATLSLAAHLRPRVAVARAILEQGHVGPYLRRMVHEEKRPVPARPEDVVTLEDHALYYVPPERTAALAFLGEAGSVSASELPEPEEVSTPALCRRVAAAGLRIAVVDVTSPDLGPTPFRVARALGAGFQQIHFGHRLARLGNPRLLAMATAGINPDPHPMA